MPLNKSYVGRTFEGREPYVVSRAAVRQFVAAIGDPSPSYGSLESVRAEGRDDIAIPPTFAIVIASGTPDDHPIFEPDFGMQYERVVHGEQEFVHHRPLRIGDEIRSSSEIVAITVAGRNELTRIQTQLLAADGEVVCTTYNTLVSRGTAEEETA